MTPPLKLGIYLTLAAASLALAVPPRVEAQAVDCLKPVEGSASMVVRQPPDAGSLNKSPDYPLAKLKARRDVGGAWMKAVAEHCPGFDTSWARAKRKNVKCGFFSSTPRYSCIQTGIPARKRKSS